MRYGTHRQLEAEADRLIREDLRGITSHAAKSDVLTPWKEAERRKREVFVPSGTPDATLRQGMFTRAMNSNPGLRHLNSRDGVTPPLRSPAIPPWSDGAPLVYLGDGGLTAFLQGTDP